MALLVIGVGPGVSMAFEVGPFRSEAVWRAGVRMAPAYVQEHSNALQF